MDTLTTFQLWLFIAFFCVSFLGFGCFMIGMVDSPVLVGFGAFLMIVGVFVIPAIGSSDNDKNIKEYQDKCSTAGGYVNQIEKDWSSQLDCIVDGKVVQL